MILPTNQFVLLKIITLRKYQAQNIAEIYLSNISSGYLIRRVRQMRHGLNGMINCICSNQMMQLNGVTNDIHIYSFYYFNQSFCLQKRNCLLERKKIVQCTSQAYLST